MRFLLSGNMSTRDLKRLFDAHLPAILESLTTNSLIELHRQSVQIVV